jgi:hypothetical protein
LWGNACHTRALAKVSKDCRELDIVEKSRLALLLMYCQLVVQGESRNDVRLQCSPEEHLKFCVKRLTDREHALYIEMLSNIDTICLYIQNQEFERHAEHMLNVLMSGSSTAGTRIKGIQRDLDILHSDLLQQRKFQENLSLNTSNSMLMIQHAFENLQLRLHSLMQDVSNAFDQIKHDASEVVEFQKEIKNDITTTFMYTESIFASIQKYQEKTDRTLSKILGSSYSKADFWFYGSCILTLFIMSSLGISTEKRLLFISWFGSSLMVERALVSQYGSNTWWMEQIPLVKSYVRKTLAILVLLFSLKRYTKSTKARKEYSKKRLKDCTVCSQRFLHTRRANPYHVTRQAFSEIILPTGKIDQDQDDEAHSFHRIPPPPPRIDHRRMIRKP